MNYTPSINIETGISDDFRYIVTPNTKSVLGAITSDFQNGHHAMTIIGTYGTGKSAFLAALERDLLHDKKSLVKDTHVFGKDITKFHFINIVGDYEPLRSLLAEKLNLAPNATTKEVLTALSDYYNLLKRQQTFLFVVVDEFGKTLEHAAKIDPEQELYFLQRLAEFCNVSTRNIILLCSLHQNFGSYARKLNLNQRDEWMKVKGRFSEIVFTEPVEQLLLLGAQQIKGVAKTVMDNKSFEVLFDIARRSKMVAPNYSFETAKSLYPLDPISAICLTMAIQRYGQNERTLFSFLTAVGKGSLQDFEPQANLTYNLANVYDYSVYTFYSFLSEANSDSMQWRAIRTAIERVESGIVHPSQIELALKLVKTIGLLNIFAGSNVSFSKEMLIAYAKNALGIAKPETVLDKLVLSKIIRYAAYKSQYILFEGTDIDIEDALLKASGNVPIPQASVDELEGFVAPKVASAVANYYRTGTPRYFEFVPTNAPASRVPSGDVDGFIQLVFPLDDHDTLESTLQLSQKETEANIYVYFMNTDEIIRHLHSIKKLQYVIESVAFEDRVAKKELQNILDYEKYLLNNAINESLLTDDGKVTWFYRGKQFNIGSQRKFKELISGVCENVYSSTPILRNELFNKQKLSSAISLARVNLLNALLEHTDEQDLGFSEKTFPPEKTIYYTLLRQTGIHRQDEFGSYMLGAPSDEGVQLLWSACEDFVKSTTEKARKLSELLKILKNKPFKLKQGVIDFWLPIYLYIRQQDFSLYNADGVYVMSITREVFELLQKKPSDFSIKAFNVTGIKMEFFHKYTTFLKRGDAMQLNSKNFISTLIPYLKFYRGLNQYAKSTTKFDHSSTAKFRDALANARDPEKTFFEELPEALGYKGGELMENSEFVAQYADLIRQATHELLICYDLFIERIECRVKEELALDGDFEDYKIVLEERYRNVKVSLLTPKTRSFLDRLMAPSATRTEFYEKIGNVILDKRLDQTKDNEEDYLIENILFLFRELERYTDIAKVLSEGTKDDEVFNFEMASNIGESKASQTYRLPSLQKDKATEIESRVNAALTGDDNLDVCVLLRLLNEKLNKTNG
jgi:hypothetical protein